MTPDDPNRSKPPWRRPGETVDFIHWNIPFRATIGYYHDGRNGSGEIAEVFLSAHKLTSAADVMIHDCGILLSLALQYGCPIEVIRKALLREENGEPAGPMGKLMDVVGEPMKNGDAT